MTFASLGLIEPLLRALETLGYQTPTPVQAQAIPAVLAGRNDSRLDSVPDCARQAVGQAEAANENR